MKSGYFECLFSTCLVFAVSSVVFAGPVAGIVRTDGQPLETGPFESQPSTEGPQITHEFQPMYLNSQPNSWTKTFRWEIPANTGLAPGATLRINESIPLLYPATSTATDSLVRLPIADWHETIVGGDVSDFLQWDAQSSNTRITARIGGEGFPIDGQVSFSLGGHAIAFNFDPIRIPVQGVTVDTPVTLDISKFVIWTGPVLDPIPFPQHFDILVSEYPTTSNLLGDYNGDDIVDAADFTVWRDNLGSGTSLPNDDTAGVGPDDYTRWKTHFGQSLGSGSGAIANSAIPEPATLVLLIVGMLAMCSRRPRAES